MDNPLEVKELILGVQDLSFMRRSEKFFVVIQRRPDSEDVDKRCVFGAAIEARLGVYYFLSKFVAGFLKGEEE